MLDRLNDHLRDALAALDADPGDDDARERLRHGTWLYAEIERRTGVQRPLLDADALLASSR